MKRRHIIQDGPFFSVLGTDGYILEAFSTHEQAEAYLADYEQTSPVSAGEKEALAAKHGALFQD